MSSTFKTETPKATAEDRANLKSALLQLGKADYENVRAELIKRVGYDQFRELQNDLFKEIVAEEKQGLSSRSASTSGNDEKTEGKLDKIAHTPGPWQIQEVRVVKMSEPVITATRIELGLRRAVKICTMPALSSAVGQVSPKAHEIAANARLIAAAPEQYESLVKIVERLERALKAARGLGTLFRAEAADEIRSARAAISKAEGK